MSEALAFNPQNEMTPFRKIAIYRWLLANLVVFAFQFAGLQMNAFSLDAGPMWFASGAATAFIFMRGLSILPGVGLGSAAAYYYVGAGALTAIQASMIWVIQTYLLFMFTIKVICPALVFKDRLQNAYFIVLSAIVTAVSTSLLMYVCLPESLSTLHIWQQWWLANLNGVLVFAIAIYTWDYYFPETQSLLKPTIIQQAILLLLMLLACFTILFTHHLFLIAISGLLSATIIAQNKYHYGWCGGMISQFALAMTLTFAALVNVSADYFSIMIAAGWVVFAITPALQN